MFLSLKENIASLRKELVYKDEKLRRYVQLINYYKSFLFVYLVMLMYWRLDSLMSI